MNAQEKYFKTSFCLLNMAFDFCLSNRLLYWEDKTNKQTKHPYPTHSNVYRWQISVSPCQMPPLPHWPGFVRCLPHGHLTLVTFPGMSSSPSLYAGARSHTPLTYQSDGMVLEKQITFFQGKVSLLTNSFQPVLLRQLSCMEFRDAASCECCCFFVCIRKRQHCWFYHCLALEEGNSCRPWEAAAFKKLRGPFDT